MRSVDEIRHQIYLFKQDVIRLSEENAETLIGEDDYYDLAILHTKEKINLLKWVIKEV
jgi:kynurenine formamidase